jgi:hypothetical protein
LPWPMGSPARSSRPRGGLAFVVTF